MLRQKNFIKLKLMQDQHLQLQNILIGQIKYFN